MCNWKIGFVILNARISFENQLLVSRSSPTHTIALAFDQAAVPNVAVSANRKDEEPKLMTALTPHPFSPSAYEFKELFRATCRHPR